MASRMAVQPRSSEDDWRVGAWDDARSVAKDGAQAQSLMEFVGAMRKAGVTDRPALCRMMRLVVSEKILNPFAYFSPGGNACQAILGELAVARAEHGKQEIQEADRRFFDEH